MPQARRLIGGSPRLKLQWAKASSRAAWTQYHEAVEEGKEMNTDAIISVVAVLVTGIVYVLIWLLSKRETSAQKQEKPPAMLQRQATPQANQEEPKAATGATYHTVTPHIVIRREK
jgi:flagellar biosynthesis/type III secretory pathway M-ring protein FliF/YscJ